MSFIDPRGRDGKYIVDTIVTDFDVYEIGWNYSCDLFFMAGGNGKVNVYGYPSLQQECALNAHASHCYSLAFDPMGRYFATGSADAIVSLWDLDTMACLRTFDKLVWPVRTISISHDGQYLASGAEDALIDISHVETGETVHSVKTSALTENMSWHPSKHLLAYVGDDSSHGRYNGAFHVFGFK